MSKPKMVGYHSYVRNGKELFCIKMSDLDNAFLTFLIQDAISQYNKKQLSSEEKITYQVSHRHEG